MWGGFSSTDSSNRRVLSNHVYFPLFLTECVPEEDVSARAAAASVNLLTSSLKGKWTSRNRKPPSRPTHREEGYPKGKSLWTRPSSHCCLFLGLKHKLSPLAAALQRWWPLHSSGVGCSVRSRGRKVLPGLHPKHPHRPANEKFAVSQPGHAASPVVPLGALFITRLFPANQVMQR